MTHQHPEHTHATNESPGEAWKEERLVATFIEQTRAQSQLRRPLFDFACDLFPFDADARIRVLDIGAGYGAFAEAMLEHFPNAVAIGLDISDPMMAVGRKHMVRFGQRFSYHVGDFADGELPANLPGRFDAVVAAAAVLHLSSEARQRLYGSVFRSLNPGGCFFNIEPIAPANQALEAWYRERRERQYRHAANQPAPLPEHSLMLHHNFESEEAYQQHQSHHHVETEANQLAFLSAAGFVRVDCFYKRLLETVIGGFKAP